MRKGTVVGSIVGVACVLLTALGSAFADHTASGGGTYEPGPGISSQFQFSPSSLQCKVAQAGAPPGLQMFMFSTAIDTFVISGNMVTITGQLASTTVTAGPPCADGCTEIVEFTAVAVDNGTPGGGLDTFELEVTYFEEQLDIFEPVFGDPTVFMGTVEHGGVNIHQ